MRAKKLEDMKLPREHLGEKIQRGIGTGKRRRERNREEEI